MAHYHDVITDLREPTRELQRAIPGTWAAFGALHEHAVAAGRISAPMKELIAVAIAVSTECDGCIAYHARAAAAKGASREELAEVLGVTLLMGGGPASIYAPRAWAAFSEFAPTAERVVSSDAPSAERWDERYGHDDLLWTAEPNRFLVAEVEDLPPGRALDLACGEGRNAVWLAEKGWNATGVDFSSVGIDKAHRLAVARGVDVTFEVADVTTYEPAAEFDLVIVMYLHLPPPGRTRAFSNAASGLAPDGTLLVVGHDITNIADGVGGPQDPGVLYGPDDVARDFAGLDVVKAERVLRPVTNDGVEQNAIDVLVRARRT